MLLVKLDILLLFIINLKDCDGYTINRGPWQNPNLMVVSKVPFCLDVRFDIAKELIDAVGLASIDDYYYKLTAEVSRIYAWHNIRFSIYDTVKWAQRNLVDIGASVGDTLWKYGELVNTLNDNADAHVLLVDINNTDKNLGKAFIDGGCTKNSFAVVQAGERTSFDPIYTAAVVAHEIGHLLGFTHVTEQNTSCSCLNEDFKCVMRPETYYWGSNVPTSFDTCNIRYLINNPKSCLLDCTYTRHSNAPAVCGDNMLQAGEECDCGFEESCVLSGRSACCNHYNCKFGVEGAQCVDEPCCSNCKFKRGNLCRSKIDECDLDDYCMGDSPWCPENIRQTGIKCAEGTAYCYAGKCMTKDHWCKIQFPNSISSYSQECTDYAMRRALTNCSGLTNAHMTELFCGSGAGICGQVYCNLQESNDPYYSFTVGSLKCYTKLDSFDETPTNKVPDGGVCEKDKVCFAHECKLADVINYKCKQPCTRNYEECDGNSLLCKPNDPRWFQVNPGP